MNTNVVLQQIQSASPQKGDAKSAALLGLGENPVVDGGEVTSFEEIFQSALGLVSEGNGPLESTPLLSSQSNNLPSSELAKLDEIINITPQTTTQLSTQEEFSKEDADIPLARQPETTTPKAPALDNNPALAPIVSQNSKTAKLDIQPTDAIAAPTPGVKVAVSSNLEANAPLVATNESKPKIESREEVKPDTAVVTGSIAEENIIIAAKHNIPLVKPKPTEKSEAPSKVIDNSVTAELKPVINIPTQTAVAMESATTKTNKLVVEQESLEANPNGRQVAQNSQSKIVSAAPQESIVIDSDGPELLTKETQFLTQGVNIERRGVIPHRIATPLEDFSVRQNVVEQIKLNISGKLQEGGGKMIVQLNPAELGKLEITVERLNDGFTRVNIIADKLSTFGTLQQATSDIQNILVENGFKDGENSSLNFEHKDQTKQQFAENEADQGFAELLEGEEGEVIKANNYKISLTDESVDIKV